jgi:hypothetical protein
VLYSLFIPVLPPPLTTVPIVSVTGVAGLCCLSSLALSKSEVGDGRLSLGGGGGVRGGRMGRGGSGCESDWTSMPVEMC